MQKLLIILLLVVVTYASDELKIYERVLPAIFKMNKLKVFVSKDLESILSKSKHFVVVNDCNDADILFGRGFSKIKKECLKKPIFATNYITFKTYINSFGAFYWRKARPQLRFKQEILDKFHLKLPNSLRKYAR